jgi:excisionase family DNA binding protein
MTQQLDLLTVTQAADELKLSVRAVQHRIRTGTLSATKLGDGRTSAYVITREEIDRAKAEAAREKAAAS